MRHLPNLFLLPLLLLLASCASTGRMAFTPDHNYKPEQLQEDLQVVETVLRNNHPSLYWYATPDEVDASFARARELCRQPMDETAFRNLLNETVGVLRCGHTSLRHSRQYNRATAGRRLSGFPLSLKVLNDSLLAVTGNLYRRDSLLRNGTQVTAINNRSARTLIDTLSRLIPTDGYARTFSYQNLSNNFIRAYNSRFPGDSSYTIRFVDARGVEREVERRAYLPGSDTGRGVATGRPAVPATAPLTPRQLKLRSVRSFEADSLGRFATLRLHTFTGDLRRSYLRKRFRKLKRQPVPNLVLDLRNNGGGLIQSSLLLTRLIRQEPFRFTDSIVTHRRRIESAAPVTKRFFTNLGMAVLSKKINDSLYGFRYFCRRTYQPHRLGYRGQVWILTGGYSFSATTLFLANVKGQSNVTLVGEETGGGYYGNNGVFIPDVILPNTRLRLRLPLYRIVINRRHPFDGRGVLPDVEVKPTAETIRRNVDPKFSKAVELMKGGVIH
ncbi:MAG TPA: S41 family peptidase [Lacibacter sp.]|nr:S41 family peptidase [Lacibacter sp.]HMO90488.1 S41 family peptidase [Lacibacter sp.]